MPRVNTATKSSQGKEISCDTCHKPIVKGEKYFHWKFRFGGKHTQHEACGRPRQSQLTQSKMSQAYAAIESVEDILATCPDACDVAEALRSAASEIESCKDEYQGSFDNMPENFQSGSTGEELQEKISALEEFQSELESAADECDDIDNEDAEDADEGDEDSDDASTRAVDRANNAIGSFSL